MKVITKKKHLAGQNIALYMLDHENEFIYLNMHPDGVWCVDTEHPSFATILKVAISIAANYGDNNEAEKLTNLLNLKN